MSVEATCATCHAPFTKTRPWHRHCKPACRVAAHAGLSDVLTEVLSLRTENDELAAAFISVVQERDKLRAEVARLKVAPHGEDPREEPVVEVTQQWVSGPTPPPRDVEMPSPPSPRPRKLCPVHAENPDDLRPGVQCVLCGP